MICSIVQPTFMPWSGFFALLDQSDTTVLLDSVAFSKQSWQQRNRIRTDKGLEYLTVPVKTAGRLGQKISHVEIVNDDFISSIEGKIKHYYRETPFFQEYFPLIIETLRMKTKQRNLAQLNVNLIRLFVEILGIKTPLNLSSSLGIEGDRSILLADICEYYSCKKYLSPQGSINYLLNDREIFERKNISVLIQNFIHPEYRQAYNPFIPYASLIDLIMNEGPQSLGVIRTGIRTPSRLIG